MPRQASEAEERSLVEAIRRGDTEAWGDLLGRYQHRLFAICLRMVGDRHRAADCAQDAMVKIMEGLPSYDGRARLSTWIYRLTMNVCISKLRSEKYRAHASLDAPTRRGDSDSDSRPYQTPDRLGLEHEPGSSVQLRQDRERLAAALLRLPDEQRAILILRDARGLEYEHIAEVLGIAVGTVKSRLFRARAALRSEIESGDAGITGSRRGGPGPDQGGES